MQAETIHYTFKAEITEINPSRVFKEFAPDGTAIYDEVYGIYSEHPVGTVLDGSMMIATLPEPRTNEMPDSLKGLNGAYFVDYQLDFTCAIGTYTVCGNGLAFSDWRPSGNGNLTTWVNGDAADYFFSFKGANGHLTFRDAYSVREVQEYTVEFDLFDVRRERDRARGPARGDAQGPDMGVAPVPLPPSFLLLLAGVLPFSGGLRRLRRHRA